MSATSQTSLGAAEPLTLEGIPGPKAFVRDLVDGQQIDSPFVVRDRTRRQKRNGESFLKLQLGDVTGSVEGVVWDGVEEIAAVAVPGAVVVVTGSYCVDQRYGSCITVRTVREAVPGSFDLAYLMDAPPISFDKMCSDLRDLIGTVQNRDLRELLDRFFAEGSSVWERWCHAPAAKHYHQAYRHALSACTPCATDRLCSSSPCR